MPPLDRARQKKQRRREPSSLQYFLRLPSSPPPQIISQSCMCPLLPSPSRAWNLLLIISIPYIKVMRKRKEEVKHVTVQSWRFSLIFFCHHMCTPYLLASPTDPLNISTPHPPPSGVVSSSKMSSPGAAAATRSWSISEDSLRRYVYYASESCIQELLSASDPNRVVGEGGGLGEYSKEEEKQQWKVLAVENGVEISKRRSGAFHIYRSRWLLPSVSPQQFITVANAIDAAKQWDPDLVEGKYIKDLDENLSIIRLRFGESSKPMFKNREFIVYERRESMEDGTLVVAVASLPKEIAAGLQPKQQNDSSIRGLLLQSGWVVEKREDDHSCMVTYVVQLDPAGWLPKCFVNRLNTKLVMIIDNLKKLAQNNNR